MLFAGEIFSDNTARQTFALFRSWVGNHRCGAQQAQRFQGNQFWIARPDAESEYSAVHGWLILALVTAYWVTGIKVRQAW